MRQFAEQEMRLTTGKARDLRFRVDRNPFTGLWFDAIDSGKFHRFVATGPSRTGKTVIGSILPVMYHLFEIGETVIYGVPDGNLVVDKWRDDLLPAIEASRYKDLIPKNGPGSRGGDVTRVTFGNGVTLRFMTAGGGDKSRAGFDSRVLVVTETDGFDEQGESSREADKLSQLEARIAGWGPDARTYLECTVSTEQGRTWQEYTKKGTQSRIAIRCQHCRQYVTPEREQFLGWKNVPDVVAAAENSHVCCPNCGAAWTEDERIRSNHDCVLVHKGQSAKEDGTIDGPVPRTDTFSLRWTAINNLLVPASDIGAREWKAANEPDEENSEQKMRQFTWALPHVPDTIDLTQLDHQVICKRITKDPKGRIPSGYETGRLTIGLDVGKYQLHWTAPAWNEEGSPHIVEYGIVSVSSDAMAVERAILTALREFRDEIAEKGFDSDIGILLPDQVLIDCGWAGQESEELDEVIYEFCKESNLAAGVERYMPSKGWGGGRYRHPLKRDARVREIGDEYHVSRQGRGKSLINVNSDHWKGKVHARLRTPIGQRGAMTLFAAEPREHLTFAKQLTAEKQEEKFEAGRGNIIRWRTLTRQNHYLDSTMLATVAGHRAGSRVIEVSSAKTAPTSSGKSGDGRQQTSWFRSRSRSRSEKPADE
jgi:phage terminase large subunit GpA-like protein